MTHFRRIFPMGAALALLALSSGCALRPVVRGELVSVSWDEAEAPPPGGGGGTVEAAMPVAVGQASPSAPSAQPRRVDEANDSKRSREVRVAQAPSGTVTSGPGITRVPVTLRAKDPSKHYEVTAPSGQKCTVPCTLDLAPGDSLVTFTGDSNTALWLKVPPNGGTLQFELAGNGRRVAAGILLGTGLVISLVGAALIPVLGGIPLIIMGSIGLACLIPGLILAAGNSNSLEWVGEPPR
jgi:hypothetical protein